MDVTTLLIVAGAGIVIGGIVGFIAGKSAASPATGGKKPATRKKTAASKGGGTELYVGNLSYDIDDALLKKEFEKCGKVVSARVIKNKYSDRSRGYGFVEMASAAEADKAVKQTHGKEIMGRKVVVNIARSNSQD